MIAETRRTGYAGTMLDLTSGRIAPALISFALPLVAGNMLQMLYNAADTIIVSWFVGPDALASVGSAYALMTFLTSILIGLAMGSGVSFSYLYARQDIENLRSSLAFSFSFIAVIAAAITAASIAFTDGILAAISIPESLIGMMKDYLAYIFPGLPFLFIYNFYAAAERAIGNSRVPLIFMGASAVMNIVLDLLFVAVFGIGIKGAAIATLISQIGASGIAFYSIAKTPILRFSLKDFPKDKSLMKETLSLSVLTSFQQSIMNLGILAVQGIVNSFGPAVMAGFAAAQKIDSLAYMPLQEFGNAFSTFVSQNNGKGDERRIRSGLKTAFIIATIAGLAVSAAVNIFPPEPLMRIFVSAEETEIISIGKGYLRIEGSFYILIGYLFLFYALFRGLKSPSVSIVLTITSLGLRVVLASILSQAIGYVGIWMSIPIGWAIADTLGMLLFRHRNHRIREYPN